MQIEDRVAVARDLGGVGLAVEHPERRPLRSAVSIWNRPAANAKRYVGSGCVSAKRIADAPPALLDPRRLGAVGQRLPARRDLERQRVSRLQIRLIEAGKRQPRARRHEQRVHELRIAIERRVAGVEPKRDLVFALRADRQARIDRCSFVATTAIGLPRLSARTAPGAAKSSASGRKGSMSENRSVVVASIRAAGSAGIVKS